VDTTSSSSSGPAEWRGQMCPWGVERMEATRPGALDRGWGVKIAILDTGIDLDHPDLQLAGQESFVPDCSADDDHGHGTMVAGIIGARDNDLGIIGIAPGASLYAVKVIAQNGEGDVEAVVKGIQWSIENQMQLINLSFGDYRPLPAALVEALEKASRAGILVIAGAGNQGASGRADSIWYPAHYEAVVAVGSSDRLDRRAPFSSTGPALELMAPGMDVVSCFKGGGYSRSDGTSFSAAYVSGIAALIFASGVEKGDEVRSILKASTQDLGSPGWDQEYGYGLVNARRALLTADVE